jgi:acetolactate synthase-1/2/3 large subunit
MAPKQCVARTRSRPLENRRIGRRMIEPAMDFAGIASTFGVAGFGPLTDPAELGQTLARAIAAVDEGRPALVDVRVAGR